MGKKITPQGLTALQESFCQTFATDAEFFGNGVQSYIQVFQPDQTKPNWYANARSAASELLTNPNVLTRINELIEATLSEQHIDKQLYIAITQNADYNAKVKGIEQANKLKGRITEKLELSGKLTLVELLKDANANPAKYAGETPPSEVGANADAASHDSEHTGG